MSPKDTFIQAFREAKAAFRAYGACQTDQLFFEAVRAAEAYQKAKQAFINDVGTSPHTPT